jgi:DNA-binding MarR family transcriptional regulator
MNDKPSDVAILAWARLMKAQRRALEGVESDLKAAGFPPLGWYDLLLELSRCGSRELRPVEIEERLLLAQHNVSRLIDRVERAGYIERRRCAEDGRGQLVALTESGQALLKTMWPVYRTAIGRHVGQHFDLVETEILAGLLGRLIPARKSEEAWE